MKPSLFIVLVIVLLSCSETIETPKQEISSAHSGKTQKSDIVFKDDTIDSLILELEFLDQDGYTKDSSAYWELVKIGEPAIPYLIENITNNTRTKCSSICREDGTLTIGDISYSALNKIADFPAFLVTGIQFCVIDMNGCGSFSEYLYNDENKEHLQSKCRDFYNRVSFKTVKLDSIEITAGHLTYGLTEKLKLEDY